MLRKLQKGSNSWKLPAKNSPGFGKFSISRKFIWWFCLSLVASRFKEAGKALYQQKVTAVILGQTQCLHSPVSCCCQGHCRSWWPEEESDNSSIIRNTSLEYFSSLAICCSDFLRYRIFFNINLERKDSCAVNVSGPPWIHPLHQLQKWNLWFRFK